MPFGERRYCETCGRRCRRLFVQLNGKYWTVGYYCLHCDDMKIGRDFRRVKKPALLKEVIAEQLDSIPVPIVEPPHLENDIPVNTSPKTEIERFKERAKGILNQM